MNQQLLRLQIVLYALHLFRKLKKIDNILDHTLNPHTICTPVRQCLEEIKYFYKIHLEIHTRLSQLRKKNPQKIN